MRASSPIWVLLDCLFHGKDQVITALADFTAGQKGWSKNGVDAKHGLY